MTRTEFENLKVDDVINDNGVLFVVTGWYNNLLIELKELQYDEVTDNYETAINERRCNYNDIKNAIA